MNVTNEFMNRVLTDLKTNITTIDWEKDNRWKWVKNELHHFENEMNDFEGWVMYQVGIQCIDFDSNPELRRFRDLLFQYLRTIESNLYVSDTAFKKNQPIIRNMGQNLVRKMPFLEAEIWSNYQSVKTSNNIFIYPEVRDEFASWLYPREGGEGGD